MTEFGFFFSKNYLRFDCWSLNVQNRLLAMNYIDEGNDDKLFEAHRLHLSPMKLFVDKLRLCVVFD